MTDIISQIIFAAFTIYINKTPTGSNQPLFSPIDAEDAYYE